MKKHKVALYARQGGARGKSVDQQLEFLREYARSEGFEIVREQVEVEGLNPTARKASPSTNLKK